MKKSLIVLAVAALAIVAALVGVAQAQKDKQVIYVSSAHAAYKLSPMGGERRGNVPMDEVAIEAQRGVSA
jgi:uncharacterized protein YxeA